MWSAIFEFIFRISLGIKKNIYLTWIFCRFQRKCYELLLTKIVQENIRNLGNYQFISKLMIFSRTKLNSGAYLFGIKVLVDQKFNDVISILNNPSITFSKCGGIICKEQWTNLSLINKDFWPIVKVEKILKGSLDLISSPSPSVKIQIMGGKVYLR